MELREWAQIILSAETIEGKLICPAELTDNQPGPPLLWEEPVRPPGMSFKRKSREEKLPIFPELCDPDKRAVCLHRFAGHELLAVEVMAFTLLAFPDAPKTFRKGLAHTLKEEQGHVKLYIDRMACFDVHFGDLPLYRHFWKHTSYIRSPKDYVCMMSLTMEMANLDFAPMFGKMFSLHGDHESAALMGQILKDEIGHVGFGWNWLKRFNPGNLNEWDVWESTLASLMLTPKRAKGKALVDPTTRLKAGIPEDWIEKLKKM